MPKKKKSKKSDPTTDAKIPASVKAAADKADEIQQGIVEATEDESSKTDVTDTSSEDANQPAADPDPEPAADPVQDNEPAADPTPADPDKDSWEHKYLVLQGKYNADIGRLNEQVEKLTGSLTTLSSQLESNPAPAKGSSEPTDPTPAPAGKLVIDLLDAAEFERYGDEFGKMAGAINALIDHVSKLPSSTGSPAADSGLVDRVQRVEQITFKSAEEKFFEKVKQAIPNYDAINKDPRLPAWLQEADPISMYQRKEMIDFAFKNLNAPQVIAILSQFANQNEIEIPTSQASSGSQTAGGNAQTGNLTDKTADDPLAAQAMPGQSVGSGGEHQGNQQATVTAADYNKAVADFTSGKIQKAEFDKIEAAFQGSLKK